MDEKPKKEFINDLLRSEFHRESQFLFDLRMGFVVHVCSRTCRGDAWASG